MPDGGGKYLSSGRDAVLGWTHGSLPPKRTSPFRTDP